MTGDEFVVLALGAPRETLGMIAGRLRRAVEGCPVPGLAAPWKLTVSIGVACGADWPTWEAALAEADRLLYEAKRQGGNRVAGPTPGASTAASAASPSAGPAAAAESAETAGDSTDPAGENVTA